MLAVALLLLALALVVTGCALVSPALALIVAGALVGAFALVYDFGRGDRS